VTRPPGWDRVLILDTVDHTRVFEL
jgi:hypothetical protein